MIYWAVEIHCLYITVLTKRTLVSGAQVGSVHNYIIE